MADAVVNLFNLPPSLRRALTLATICAGAVLLNSCGSGAVSSPAPTDPAAGTPLAVSPPVADLFADIPTTFTVTGGKAGYTAFSSNSAVLPVTATVNGASFVVTANAVAADTSVDITVRDSVNASATAKANVKPSTLNSQITFTPFSPTGAGCGANTICSGGDAQVVVKAVLNSLVLRARPIRFDALQGSFQFVTPGTGTLVSSLVVNTDEQGEATVRIAANAGAATQVATFQSTDVTSGLARRYNFNIVQQTSGTGIITTLPSATISIKGAKGAAGQDGFCPGSSAAAVDFYVYGGTPPYAIASPLPNFASVSPGIVTSNGGRFTGQLTGCGSVRFIVTDSTGRTVETSLLEGVQGDKGDAVATTTFAASPTALTLGCGQSGTINLTGSGSFAVTVVQAAASPPAFTVSPLSGTVPGTITMSRAAGTIPTPSVIATGNATTPTVTVNIISGNVVTPISVFLAGGKAGNPPGTHECPP